MCVCVCACACVCAYVCVLMCCMLVYDLDPFGIIFSDAHASECDLYTHNVREAKARVRRPKLDVNVLGPRGSVCRGAQLARRWLDGQPFKVIGGARVDLVPVAASTEEECVKRVKLSRTCFWVSGVGMRSQRHLA